MLVSTRDDILRLRAVALREAWACERCGQPIAAHHHNFECLDACTRALRAFRVRTRTAGGGQRAAQPNRSR